MGVETREVPLAAPFRAGDVPMLVVTSIVHGIFLLVLLKVCLRRAVGNAGSYCRQRAASQRGVSALFVMMI